MTQKICEACGEEQDEFNKHQLCRYWGNREEHIWKSNITKEDTLQYKDDIEEFGEEVEH